MSEIRGHKFPSPESDVEADAGLLAEQLEAMESRPAESVEHLREATIDASVKTGIDLGLWLKDETRVSTLAYEEWNEVTDGLEDLFFEIEGGVLAHQLLELLALSTDELQQEPMRTQAIDLIRQTEVFARRLRPLVDRLASLHPGTDREAVIARLCVGDLDAPFMNGSIPVPQRRLTLVGSLQELGRRLGGDIPEAALWELRHDVPLPQRIVLRDPFSRKPDVNTHWRIRTKVYKKLHPEKPVPTIFFLSQEKTKELMGDLEVWRATVEEDPKKTAVAESLMAVEEWLERKLVFYKEGSEKDIELYHLGMEPADELIGLIGALDVIKREKPEQFLEMCGMTAEGNKSSGFGTFLHKALFNTQRAVDDTHGHYSNLILRQMLRQLLTMDQRVTIYHGVGNVTPEQYRALAEQTQKSIAAASPQDRALLAASRMAALIRPAIAAEVDRQLEAMKEVNMGDFKKRLRERINDLEHPLLLLEYLANAPVIIFQDPEIKADLRAIFHGMIDDEPREFQRECRERSTVMVRRVFDRIPLFDYEACTLGQYLPALMTALGEQRSFLAYHAKRQEFLTEVNPRRRGLSMELLVDTARQGSKMFPGLQGADPKKILEVMVYKSFAGDFFSLPLQNLTQRVESYPYARILRSVNTY